MLESDYTDYAIMINGEWGSVEKHHFWNNKVRKKIESLQLNGKKYTTIYMSLYGISNLEEIKQKNLYRNNTINGQKLKKIYECKWSNKQYQNMQKQE